MTMTRRDFLGASAALAAAPALGARALAAPLPREADIVVIGAGAAGIAAARRIVAANRKVIVVEAASQIGGRCVTDTATFGVPFDRGARWMHNPDTNPLIKLARAAGLDISAVPLGQKIRIGRRYARAGETEEFLAALVRANRAIDDASHGKTDAACASVLPNDLGDWAGTAEFVLGANATGKDLREISVIDRAHGLDRSAAISCRQGLGTLIAKLGEQIPVSLSTPANRVSWSNRDVAVETPSGKIVARAAVITVSSNVLTAGNIKFNARPPETSPRRSREAEPRQLRSHRAAVAGQSAGACARRHPHRAEQFDADGAVVRQHRGSSLCSIDVAGSFGRDLSSQGEKAMVAFGLEWLAKLFGSDAAAAVKKSSVTRWDAAPFALGAMSAAAPGAQPLRKTLAEPIGCMFLAGEATHENLWGTIDGAWESGERAAEAALRRIGALRDTEPAARPRSQDGSAAPRRSGPQCRQVGSIERDDPQIVIPGRE